MYKAIIAEYGIPWVINRSLYSAKLKMMRLMPVTENLFEKKVDIKRIDIFQVDANKIATFLNDISDGDKKEIVKIADNALEGKIRAFSSIVLDYGSPINWHLNPITKVEVEKNSKWYKIRDFDPVRGDIKAIWEASRFTHLYYIVRAYMLTNDIKYYFAFSKQIEDWINNNTYSYGANYKCGQEATLRMINILFAFSVFNVYGLTTIEDESNIKKIVEGSYKKVLSNFYYAHKCIKNNHTLSEITGLIIGAWCSRDEVSLRKSYKLMNKEVSSQFMSDGGYIQFSFNYQRFALQIMELVFKLSNTTGLELSSKNKEFIKKSALMMYQVQDESGDVPNYGSNDGALIFPVTTCDYRDFRSTINTIYAVLTGNKLYLNGNYDEELMWFSDIDPKELPYVHIPRVSMTFEEFGINVMRHDNGFLMTVLQNFKTRPAQMDQMHVDLWHRGINILCDSGTYSYASELGQDMALTAAHNTIKVDGIEQMKKVGPFLIYDWTKVKNLEFVDNHFRGIMISKNGYTHIREIYRNIDGYFIEDQVLGDFSGYKKVFHTICDLEKTEQGVDLILDNRLIAKIITSDEIIINKCYRSLKYLNKERINEIVICSTMTEVEKIQIILI